MAQEQRYLVIDCEPTSKRPDTHLKGLFEGTSLKEENFELIGKSFGEWTWKVKPEAATEYERRRNLIAERMKQLYVRGAIRYGSW